MKKKFLCCLLVILNLISLVGTPISAISIVENDTMEKIDSYLLEQIDNSTKPNEEFTVSVWFSDISQADVNAGTAKKVKDLIDDGKLTQSSYNQLRTVEKVNINQNKTALREEAQLLLETKRSVSKKLYQDKNTSVVADVVDSLGLQQEDVLYVCSYAPNATLSVNEAEIYQLAQNSNVESIALEATTLSDDTATTSTTDSSSLVDLSVAMNSIGVSALRTLSGLSGSGMKIGMIERSTPWDMSFLNDNIIRNPNTTGNTGYSAHASKVAGIMVGREVENNITTFTGVVPNATLYCSPIHNNYSWKKSFEWLISQGISVINVSDTVGKPIYTTYNDVARWVDHISYQHGIVIVAAVGYFEKNGSYCVSPLAFSKNAIVVGAVNVQYNNGYEFSTYDNSAYTTSSVFYPHVVAPGNIDDFDNIDLGEIDHGNSFSAPLVVGLITQLMQYEPSLIGKSTLVKSIIMTGANGLRSSNETHNSGTAMDQQFGAGVVNASKSLSCIASSAVQTKEGSFSTGEITTKSHILNINQSIPMRIALNWDTYSVEGETYNTFVMQSPSIVYLTLTSPSGVVYSSTSSNDTFQLLSFTPPSTDLGNYTLTVQRFGPSSYNLTYALAVDSYRATFVD